MSTATRIRNLYGWLALICAFVVIIYPVTPATRFQLPMLFIFAFGVGTGLALGGVRFGNGASRVAAVVSLITFLGTLALLLAHRLLTNSSQ